MIGLGVNGGGICSAEELANAITAQKQTEAEFEKTKKDIEARKMAEMDGKILDKPEKIKAKDLKARKDAPATVEVSDTIPF
jgi:hypothetical protein